MKEVELLSPAGSYEGAVAAINAGADAIYIGGSKFGARAYAKNTDEESMLATIEYAHLQGRKVFLTLNTLLKDREITEDLYDFILPMYRQGLDGVIVQDLGVFSYLKENFKGLPLHCSTQMTISNLEGAKFMTSQGADRVVLSRELSLPEIRKITETGIETECFVHGALCYSYSGQCLLSSMIGGRSGNRGRCAQPCRLPYKIDGNNKYILSPKDICAIEFLPDLINSGIYSFKIEGRMKRAEYTAAVTSVYRKYIDLALTSDNKYQVSREDMQILLNAGNRKGFSNSYYFDHNGRKMISFDRPDYDTGGEEFFKFYEDSYLNHMLKVSLDADVCLKTEQPAILTLKTGDCKVTVTGAVVQRAVKAPLNRERILKQLNKTGDSPFRFDCISLNMDSNIFMPVNELNELRRKGLEAIKNKILMPYYRENKQVSFSLDGYNNERVNSSINTSLAVYVESLDNLTDIIKYDKVSRIYINASSFSRPYNKKILRDTALIINGAGIECYYVFPHVLRDEYKAELEDILSEIETAYDGIMVRNIDQLGFLNNKKYKGNIIGDYSLYAYNRYSHDFLIQQGVKEFCAPVELNYKELKHSPVHYSEYYAYGYMPLMVSAQCVRKTLNSCDRSNSVTNINDRYKESFTVKSYCDYCYSIVYNGKPHNLCDKQRELGELGISRLRISFTNETSKQINSILQFFSDIGDISLKDFTRGHYNRGVD